MVIRFDTRCPQCHRDNVVFGHDMFCHDCQVRGVMKSSVRVREREKAIRKEVQAMKPELRKKICDELLKEILAEHK